MKLRLATSVILALAFASAIAAGDTYSVTYQATATSRSATLAAESFALARKVTTSDGGPNPSRQQGQTGNPTSGQLQFKIGTHAPEYAMTFKKGASFYKLTVKLSEPNPAGVYSVTRTWTLTHATVTSYSVTGIGVNAVATAAISWDAITVS